jgi:hypothetical protein
MHELDRRLRKDLERKGDFSRIHPLPQSGQDVPDDLDARLVVLDINHPYSKEPGSAAEAAAKLILESRGNSPRHYRNTLVFLAADKTRLQDLDEAARRFLAWESILADKGEKGLNLDPQQVKQAETQRAAADSAVTARLPETYQWLLAPVQSKPESAVEWQALRLSGQDALAVRASKKLKNDELLITAFAATRLRMEMDRIPLWRGNHVGIKQLAEDFASFNYLPRLKDSSVLIGAIRAGLPLFLWMQDSFAFADSYDESAGRYRGLRCGVEVHIAGEETQGLLVKPDVACRQMDEEKIRQPGNGTAGGTTAGGEKPATTGAGAEPTGGPDTPPATPKLTRFHGTVTLDPARVGRDASRIAAEVIAHLSGLVGAKVTVTLEVEADIPSGAPDHVVRTVTENSRTLKFTNQEFEKE